MTAELEELFDRAGREAPTPVLDADDLLTLARRTRTRRRTATLAAVAGVAVLAAGVVLWAGSTRPTAAPIDPSGGLSPTATPTVSRAATPPPGPIDLASMGRVVIATPTDSAGQTCTVGAVDPATGDASPVALRPVVSCAWTSLVWSPDGRGVAGVADSKLWVWTAGSEHGRLLATCSRCAGLMWASDGGSIAVVDVGTSRLSTYDIATGTSRQVDLPFGTDLVTDAAVSPDGSEVAAVVGFCPAGTVCPGSLGTAAEAWRIDLVTVATGARRTIVNATGLGLFPVALKWSPTSSTVAYVELHMSKGVTETGVRVKSVDVGSGVVTTLHDNHATCYCVGASPSLVWAPDGSAVAASVPDGKLDVSWAVYVVGADGHGWRRLPRTGYSLLGWRPAT